MSWVAWSVMGAATAQQTEEQPVGDDAPAEEAPLAIPAHTPSPGTGSEGEEGDDDESASSPSPRKRFAASFAVGIRPVTDKRSSMVEATTSNTPSSSMARSPSSTRSTPEGSSVSAERSLASSSSYVPSSWMDTPICDSSAKLLDETTVDIALLISPETDRAVKLPTRGPPAPASTS